MTYMNNNNGFDPLIYVIFAMSPQLGVLRPKAQDIMILFRLSEVETIPKFNLRALQIISKIFPTQD